MIRDSKGGERRLVRPAHMLGFNAVKPWQLGHMSLHYHSSEKCTSTIQVTSAPFLPKPSINLETHKNILLLASTLKHHEHSSVDHELPADQLFISFK